MTVSAAVIALLLSSCASLTIAPTHTPSPDPSTPAAASAAPQTQAQMFDDLWKYYTAAYPNAVRPEVTFVRYVQENEMAQVQADCLHGEGFPDVSATRDGGLASGTVPEAQSEAYQVASYVCEARYPLDPKYSVPLTDERLGVLYDYYVNKLSPCLEKEGYPVPPAPSKSTFIANYLTGGWTPYLDLSSPFVGAQEEWYRINEACPQWPADFYG